MSNDIGTGVDQPNDDRAGFASATRIMIDGGCVASEGSSAKTIALSEPDGHSGRFHCGRLDRDSMLALGRLTQHELQRGRAVYPSATAGYSGWETVYKEYCWVKVASGRVINCGVFLPMSVPQWFGGSGDETSPFEDWWDGGSGGGGSGSATPATPTERPRENCDQNVDPLCFKPMTPAERQKISDAMNNYMRAEASIPDTAARNACGAIQDALEYILTVDATADSADTYLFTGRSDKTDDLGQGSQAHAGVHGQGHIDPFLFRNANNASGYRALLQTALHETVHVYYGFLHPNADSLMDANPNLPPTYLQDDYFRYIYSHDSQTACISW